MAKMEQGKARRRFGFEIETMNMICRATHYRSNHYQVMSSFGNHIIAMDYRGYGDSTGKPTVNGVVADVTHVFNVIRRVCPDNPIVIWGHSMGTGVSLWTAFHLFENKTRMKFLNKEFSDGIFCIL